MIIALEEALSFRVNVWLRLTAILPSNLLTEMRQIQVLCAQLGLVVFQEVRSLQFVMKTPTRQM